MSEALDMNHHFSSLAPSYRAIRTTDVEPVLFISEMLKSLPEIRALDVGCGCGRYDLLLFQHLNNLHLTCMDINGAMLEQVSEYLKSHNITEFKTIKGDANVIPLEDNSMDCVLTFNAVHHFDYIKFIENSHRVIKKDGAVFIYTRLRSQNARNIWGRYFPLFSEKETRLYELDEIERWLQAVGLLRLDTVREFKYKRCASLEELTGKVKARHYSTFSMYSSQDELEAALEVFRGNLNEKFEDASRIEWFDENILLALRPTRERIQCGRP
jgi:ubiquinone/menaquinone biosynthesis C-methylase UbiE